jgi:regulation of enolase protein 1 (concanavalin A-like superfamily)
MRFGFALGLSLVLGLATSCSSSTGGGGGDGGAGSGASGSGASGAGGSNLPGGVVDLGDGWKSVGLGRSSALGGSATRTGDAFTVIGGGGDFSGDEDDAQLVYREIEGDFELTVDIESFGAAAESPGWQAGLVFKARGTGDSVPTGAGAGVFQTLNLHVDDYWFRREASGVDISGVTSSELNDWAKHTRLRIRRVGNVFTTYHRNEADTAWEQHGGEQLLDVGPSGYVGIAATSADFERLAEVRFANVSLIAGSSSGSGGAGGEGGSIGSGGGGTGGDPSTSSSGSTSSSSSTGSGGGGSVSISNVQVTNVGKHSAQLSFATNVPTTAHVDFDLNQWSKVVDDSSPTTNHSMLIDRMMSGQMHDYRITVWDTSANQLVDQLRVLNTASYAGSALPNGWMSKDIGPVGATLPGSASYDASINGGTFTVRGTGTDVFNAQDSFHFVYHPVAGDFSFTVKVDGYYGYLHMWTKAMTMFRVDLDDDSVMFNQSINYSGNDIFYYRGAKGANHTQLNEDQINPVVGQPVWVRLTRAGNLFTVYRSDDGVNFSVFNFPYEVALPANGYVGFGVCGKSNSYLSEIVYSNVTLVD